jgi:hypothetical protein
LSIVVSSHHGRYPGYECHHASGLPRVPLDDGDKAKFLVAEINGEAFLYAAGQMDFFFQADIAMGPSLQLAQLAKISKFYLINATAYHLLSSISLASFHLHLDFSYK